jgi:hypothetical protein
MLLGNLWKFGDGNLGTLLTELTYFCFVADNNYYI